MAEGFPIRVYRGNLADLPASAAAGTPMWAQDVARLFFGAGTGVDPLELKVPVEQVTGLLVNGKLRGDLVPDIAINDVIEVADIAARDALTVGGQGSDVQTGDIVNVADADGQGNSAMFIVTGAGGFSKLASGGAGGVQSVNGMSDSVIVLTTDKIDEGTTNLYYTDQRVSTFLATLINKADGIAGLDADGKLSIDQFPAGAVKAGDDATRLGSGNAQAGALLASDGAGGTQWATSIDGGTFA